METMGNSLVMVVINIHIKLKIMAMVTGCFRKRLSKLQSKNNFMIKSRRIPAIRGSVGRETPKPKSESLMVIAKGVRKTTIHTSLSKAKKYSNIKNKPIGKAKA